MMDHEIKFDKVTIRVIENDTLETGKILFVSGASPHKIQVLTGVLVDCVDENGDIVDQYVFHEAIQEWNRNHT
jgi:hypothetical protein